MKKNHSPEIAPEQYELHTPPAYQFGMNRRRFFGVLGSGVAVAVTLTNSLASSLGGAAAPEDQVAAWIHIGANGKITVYSGKAEVGQNIRTSLAQVVAEELVVPMGSVEMILGDTDLTPYDRGTFGSRSTPYMGPQLRKAAATAREHMLDLASAQWKVKRENLFVEGGSVKNRSGNQTVDFGNLTKGKALILPVKDDVKLTPIDEWKVAGTSVPKVNGESFLTGKHQYVSDMKLPGMLYGKVLRAPAFGATLQEADLSAARRINGVTVVKDGDFVGVAAPSTRVAREALALIKSKWSFKEQPARNEIFTYLKTNASGKKKAPADVTKAFEDATLKVEQSFQVDYIAHAPLEPRAGLARWEGNKVTVWTGTQRPFGVQEELATVFGIPKKDARVIQPDTGSGYGGKHTGEAGIEAARLSKECGKPVKVVWTREEEFTWAYLRPAGVIDVKASVTPQGFLNAWEFHNYNSGGSGIETPYDVTHKFIEFHPVESPLRQGSYRGLAATANVFARECIMDDLAATVKMDPLEFRLKNLSEPRMKAVLEAAAQQFGWKGSSRTPGNGVGIACGTEKASFIATCAEVSVDGSGIVKVLRVVAAFECGGIINPEHLKNQIQGSVIQGLGGALFEKIDFKEGKILNPLFSRYRVPRFSDTPILEIVMLNRRDIPPAGAGETPILGIAPAIRNAIANANGKRLYTLPLMQ